MSAPLETIIEWEGRSIRLSYSIRRWDTIDHVEIRSEDSEAPPVTQTGYRSHFFGPVEPPLTLDEVAEMVRRQLDEAARDPAWIEAQQRRRQYSLF